MAISDELPGHWVRLSQSPKDFVLAPRGSHVPPSRNPMAIEFRDDGIFLETTPGPTDRAQTTNGRWSIDDDALRLTYEDDRPDRMFKVSAEGGQLVLTKLHD